MAEVDQTVDALRQAVASLEAEKRAVIKSYDQRIASVNQAIAAFVGADDMAPAVTLAISDERLSEVRQHMHDHPHARQADIVAALVNTGISAGSASGSVSVALRILAKEGVVRRLPGVKERGSSVWEYVRVRTPAA